MIKFNGDLSTSDLSQWDSETDTDSRGAYSGGYYAVTTPTAAETPPDGLDAVTAYLSKAITPTFALHGKFTFKALLNDSHNGLRSITVLELFNGSTGNLKIAFRSNSLDKELADILISARSAANSYTNGGVVTLQLGEGGSPFTADTDSDIQFYCRMSTNDTTPNGVFMLWIDTNLLIDETTVDWSQVQSVEVDTVRNGCVVTNINPNDANEETWSFKDFQLSNNGLYDTDASQTYWLDGTNGTELGTGAESSPMKSALTAMSCPVIGNGDMVKLADNGKKVPMRAIDTGPLEFPADGTAVSMMTVDGNDAIYTGSTEHEVTGAGEHEITGIVQDPNRILVCTQADWDADGWDALDARIIGNGITEANNSVDNVGGAAIPTTGTVTSLASGEAGYSGTSVFYNSGGTAVHIEVPIRRVDTSVDDVIQLKKDYVEYKNMSVWLGRLKTFRCTGAGKGVGSVVTHSTLMEGWEGVANNADTATDFYMCEIAYSREYSTSSDCIVSGAGSTGNVIACLVHHGTDDGISFSNGAGDAIGNVVHSGGYITIGSNAGIEFTGTSATGGAYFNTIVGWQYRGILLNTGTVDPTVKNNIVANCKGNSYHGTSPQAASIFEYNCSYNPTAIDFYITVTGEVSPSNVTTADPDFTSLEAGSAIADRFTDDYHLLETSPCIDFGIKYWGTEPRPSGRDGEPYPDSKIDIGAYQTLFDPNHPANL